MTPPTPAIKIGVVLLLLYVLWLCGYTDRYVETIAGRPLEWSLESIWIALNNLIANVNAIVHEAGHGVCYLLACPEFLTFMNGTNFQLALPLFFIGYYRRRSNRYLVGLGGLWFAQNLVSVAWYMSTAQTLGKYPDFLGNEHAIHDFWYLFARLGVLEYTGLIAGSVRALAILLLLGFWGYLFKLAFLDGTAPKRRRPGGTRKTAERHKLHA